MILSMKTDVQLQRYWRRQKARIGTRGRRNARSLPPYELPSVARTSRLRRCPGTPREVRGIDGRRQNLPRQLDVSAG